MRLAAGAASPVCAPGSGAGEIGEACAPGGVPGYTVCTGGTGAANTIDCAPGATPEGNCIYGGATLSGAGGCTGGNSGSPDSYGDCRVGPIPAV